VGVIMVSSLCYKSLSLAALGRDSLDRLCSVPSASRPVMSSSVGITFVSPWLIVVWSLQLAS
jgi:hypothetical protein